MNRRAGNITRHALATCAGALAALLGGEPIPADGIVQAAEFAAHAQPAAGAVPGPIDGITILEGRWEVTPIAPEP